MKSLLTLILLLPTLSLACPEIYEIPDFNCDGSLQISVLGDSLVSGFGDTKNKNKGGYVLRTQKKLPDAIIQNLGVKGLRTGQLSEMLKDAFDRGKNNKLKLALQGSDIIILDLGRNDRWLFGLPSATAAALRDLANGLRAEIKKLTELEPMVVIANNMLPNRGSQGPWVKELNTILLKNSTSTKPSDLRFDTASKRLLGFDQIHPSAKGYDSLTKIFLKYLKGSLAKRMRALRVDTDLDSLPDIIEDRVRGTDPNLADTDGDGKSDGAEVLTLGTNPLVVD